MLAGQTDRGQFTVGAGAARCGDVVDAAGLGLARPDGKSARVGNDLHVGALRLVLTRIPSVIALLGALTHQSHQHHKSQVGKPSLHRFRSIDQAILM